MRITLLVIVTLAIGFALGWFSHSDRHAMESAPINSDRTDVLATPSFDPAVTKVGTITPEPSTREPDEVHRTRLDTLRWLKQAGAPVRFQAFARDGFMPALLKIVGLTPDETARLESAAAAAKQEVHDARMARAKPSMSEDGKTFLVEVPPIDATASRAIYENLLGTVKSTLGPERYAVFTELTDDSFELGFDQFGLNSLRYELTLEPRFLSAEGKAYFEYKRHFLDPSGGSKGWGGSTLSIDQLEKNDPILSHFLPARMKSEPTAVAKP